MTAPGNVLHERGYMGFQPDEEIYYSAHTTGSVPSELNAPSPGNVLSSVFGIAGSTVYIIEDARPHSGAELNISGVIPGTAFDPNDTFWFYIQGTQVAGSPAEITATLTCQKAGTATAPTLNSISPNTGAISGGDVVTITGTGFTGATAVTFGGTPATSFTVNSATQIAATVPAHAIGAVDVVVSKAAGTATLSSGYTFAPPSSVATLSALTPSSGSLSPAFNSATPSYTVSVPNGTSSVSLTPTVTESHATTTVNGTSVASGAASGAISLSVGNNAISVVVTAQDGTTTKTYIVTVNRAPPPPSATSANPASGPVAGGTSVIVTGNNLTGATAVTFGGIAATSFTVDSATQITAITPPRAAGLVNLIVTTPGGTATLTNGFTYVAPSTVATLSNLTLSAGAISPTFASGTTSYTAAVVNAVSSLTVTPTATDANATVTVAGSAVVSGSPSGAVALAVGDNTITVVGTAEDGTTTKTYTITVNRAPSPPSATSVNPASGPAAGGTSVVISGNDFTGATAISFGGTAAASFTVDSATQITATTPAHAAGSVDLAVTTPGGTSTLTNAYTYIPPSNDAALSNLALSTGTLSPAFASGTLSYAASVGHAVSSLTLTPTASEAHATVTVDGLGATSGSASGSIALAVGDNTIVVAVTAEDGTTTQNYSVVVHRAPPQPNATSLTPASGPAAGGTSVAISGTDLAGATAVTFDGVAATSFTVDSANQITATVPSHVAGTADVTVTTPGGTSILTDGYTYVAPSSDATLSNLSLSSGTLSPGFTPVTSVYSASVANSVLSLTVTPTVANAAATVTVEGNPVASGYASGAINLNVGDNTLTISVTAEDGTSTQTYSVVVTRAPAPPSLASLTPASGTVAGGTNVVISGVDLAGATALSFGSSPASSYTVDSPNQITATAPAGSPGVVDVMVTTPGGTDTLANAYTYVASSVATLSNLSIPSGTLSPIFNSGVLSYSASVPNAVSAITVTPTLSDGNASVTVNGNPVSSGSASGSIGLTPGMNIVTITVTAQDGIAAQSYTLSVTRLAAPLTQTPSGGPLPNATYGAAYNATVTASGGSAPYAYSLTGGALPAGLSLDATTGVLSGTPTVPGSFAFTVTSTDAATATGSANYTLVIDATVPDVPLIGTVVAGDEEATVSFSAPASDGGSAVVSYTVTASPGSVSATGTSSPITVTGLDNGTTYTFTVTANNSIGSGSPSATSNPVAPEAALLPPVANPTAVTVAANSSGTSVPLTFSGGSPTSLGIASAPAHGTASISGTTISYSPFGGYSGPDSFSFTATNAAGTSVPATVSVTVSPPTIEFSPWTGALPSGRVGIEYNRTVTATSGTAPYSFVVTAGILPAGLALNSATGLISGTPTYHGNFNFTVAATDANNASASASYSLSIAPAPSSFSFTPAGGALGEAMAGEDYSQLIVATGGTGTMMYRVSAGALPAGMVLNISTGELTGPLSESTEGNYSFKIEVRDGTGSTGSTSYTLQVKRSEVTVTDKTVDVPAGSTPANIYLNRGATGGPFTSAAVISVEPPGAGTATIIQGELAQLAPTSSPVGWYLKFSPNPAFSGSARVGFRLTSALGASNPGMVTYYLHADVAEVAGEIDTMVKDFVRSRQSLIAASIEVPGLLERRRAYSDPVTARMMPSEDGLTLGFSTSLSQIEAARDVADGASASPSSALNFWIDGILLAHNRNSNEGWGSFAVMSLGADYLLSEHALFGFSLHYDHMSDPADEDAAIKGDGWLAGPYSSIEIGTNVFWDTSLLYGGSSNDVDTRFWGGEFDTSRLLLDTSITGEWEIGEAMVLTPRLRAVYFTEKADDYQVTNEPGDTIGIEGFDEEQFRLSLGAEMARSYLLENGGTLTPSLGGTVGLSNLDGSGVFGSISAGISFQAPAAWNIEGRFLLDFEGDGEKVAGGRIGASTRF
ncbi:cadherin-like beta sandwich domain-containing protein [Ensifer sp. ENS04]|uniref:cadherin-like beta sandwich domain-containing protein n=1 Tax=Ensifer sp. ENS04 TaxID=2769281 RepID=UPI001783E74B|nr:cadherin-like beta sandwich domain-containing protein [Ensifer sp. ENS04]MBD9544758.1 cadherin-like beta sandwich domain-containing protein [Ensifer sp. ENS04]